MTRGTPRLVARVSHAEARLDWIELVVPDKLSPAEFRRQIIEGEWSRQWLQTSDGDWINLSHIWILSVLSR